MRCLHSSFLAWFMIPFDVEKLVPLLIIRMHRLVRCYIYSNSFVYLFFAPTVQGCVSYGQSAAQFVT